MGRKTQTRRVVKATVDSAINPTKCPYGQPGDRLWVKETYQTGEYASNDPSGYVYRSTDPDWETTPGWKWKPSIFMPRQAARIFLNITDVRAELLQSISTHDAICEGIESFRPVPGDGAPETQYKRYTDIRGLPGKGKWTSIPEFSFRTLWESINGPKSWDDNPYVWVIKFDVIHLISPL